MAGVVLVAIGLLFQLERIREPTRAQPLLPDARFRPVEVAERVELEDPAAESMRVALDAPQSADVVLARVQDSKGASIADAAIWIVGDLATRLGLTDETGSAHVHVPSTRPLRLASVHAGYATSEGEISEEGAAEIVLILEPEARIQGTVAWSKGGVPEPGVVVAAWPDGHRPTPAVFRALRSSDPAPNTAVATTDDEGRFALRGLAHGASYTLAAGGAGGLTLRKVAGVRVEGPSVQLELTPVYAAVVRLREAEGRSLRSGSQVYGRGPGWYDDEGGAAEVVMGVPASCFLVLDPGLWQLRPTTLSRHIVLLSTPLQKQDLPTIVYEVEAPGYAPVWTHLRVPRIQPTPPEYKLALEPKAGGWGTLTVRIEGPSLELEVEGENSLAGQVLLEGDKGEQIGIPIQKPLSRVTKVEGVPFGRYRARFRSWDGMRFFPDEHQKVSVVIDAKPAVLTIDASSSCCLLATLLLEDKREYQGEVVFRLHGPTGKPYVAFDRSPYVLEGIAPGHYTLYVDSIPGRSLPVLSVPVVLEPGGVDLPRIELPF